jgi:hypothetical protein
LPSAAGKMLPFKKKVNIRNTMNNLKNHGSDIAAYIKEFKMKKKKEKKLPTVRVSPRRDSSIKKEPSENSL